MSHMTWLVQFLMTSQLNKLQNSVPKNEKWVWKLFLRNKVPQLQKLQPLLCHKLFLQLPTPQKTQRTTPTSRYLPKRRFPRTRRERRLCSSSARSTQSTVWSSWAQRRPIAGSTRAPARSSLATAKTARNIECESSSRDQTDRLENHIRHGRAVGGGGDLGDKSPPPQLEGGWKFYSFEGVCEAIGGWKLQKFSRLTAHFWKKAKKIYFFPGRARKKSIFFKQPRGDPWYFCPRPSPTFWSRHAPVIIRQYSWRNLFQFFFL